MNPAGIVLLSASIVLLYVTYIALSAFLGV